MGNAMTRRQREEGGDGVNPPPPPPPVHAPNPPRVYAQYPSPTAQYPDRTQVWSRAYAFPNFQKSFPEVLKFFSHSLLIPYQINFADLRISVPSNE